MIDVSNMLVRHDVGLGLIEKGDEWSSFNESQEMEKELIFFHSPDSIPLRNGSMELIEYVEERLYALNDDSAFNESDRLRDIFNKACSCLSEEEQRILHAACVDAVHAMADRHAAREELITANM